MRSISKLRWSFRRHPYVFSGSNRRVPATARTFGGEKVIEGLAPLDRRTAPPTGGGNCELTDARACAYASPGAARGRSACNIQNTPGLSALKVTDFVSSGFHEVDVVLRNREAVRQVFHLVEVGEDQGDLVAHLEL